MEGLKLGIMQPYLFPYLAYYQLIHCADRFAILDDVGFILGGWVNRNRILVNGRQHMFTAPLVRASPNRHICETKIFSDRWRGKLLRTFRQAYAKAPNQQKVMSLVEGVLQEPYDDIGAMAFASVRAVCDYLDIGTQFIPTTSVYGNGVLKGQDRVIDICLRERATEYVNSIGGRFLYQTDAFAAAGINLRFLEGLPTDYRQLGASFVPNLSIIDVLMFNGPAEVRSMLDRYKLVSA